MAHRLLVSSVLLGASLAAFGPVLAQAPTDATSPATAPAGSAPAPAAQGSEASPAPAQSPAPQGTATAAPAAPAEHATPTTRPPATADTLKKARMAGYRPETRHGQTVFCRESANIGTRFPTKTCLDEDQLKSVVDVNTQQQDSLRKPPGCTAGGACGTG